MAGSSRVCRLASLLILTILLPPSSGLAEAQGLSAAVAKPAVNLGTQLLWSRDGIECIAGCNGMPEPVRLGGGTNWQVAVTNFVFTAETLDIAIGDSVTWTNMEGKHNVRADDDSFRCANGCDGQGGDGTPSSNPWVVTLTFLDAATIPYFCELHGADNGAGMSGVINVIDPLVFEDDFENGDTTNWDATVN